MFGGKNIPLDELLFLQKKKIILISSEVNEDFATEKKISSVVNQ